MLLSMTLITHIIEYHTLSHTTSYKCQTIWMIHFDGRRKYQDSEGSDPSKAADILFEFWWINQILYLILDADILM